jgi:hypothetical protein
MSLIKSTAIAGLSTLSLSLLSIYGNIAVAQEGFASITSLPVITDDCGGMGCSDRRGLSLAQLQARLTAESNGNGNGNGSSNGSNGGNAGGSGQGLSLGQGNNDTQVVFLDFEQSSPTFTAIAFAGVPEEFDSHQYTQAERDEIQSRLEADYEGFNISFTQQLPTSGDFARLNFECQDEDGICTDFGGGILFGRAEAIDIGNANRNDVAFIDVGLWEILGQISPPTFEAISGIAIVDGDVTAAVSQAIINQAANTGAHELGHNLGLRHHDSFGSPGTGIPTTGTPAREAFFPTFDGLQEGDEAILHTMASGASVGTGFTDSTVRDRFFSERAVIKLAAAERGRLVNESDVSGGNKKVQLRKVVAPNTLLEGENADGKLDIREALIRGAISETGEVDSYRFRGKAGEFLSAEFNGFDVAVGDSVIGAVSLFFVENDGSLTLVAENFQNFEGFDAFLIDAPIEESGDYVLQVSAPNELSFGLLPDGTPDIFPLDETGNGALRSGDYNLSIYMVDGRPGNGPSQVPGAGN